MPAGCNCGPNSPLARALGCHCVRRGTESLPVSCHFRGCKVPLSRIVSGAISSELALPLPFTVDWHRLTSTRWDPGRWAVDTSWGWDVQGDRSEDRDCSTTWTQTNKHTTTSSVNATMCFWVWTTNNSRDGTATSSRHQKDLLKLGVPPETI